MTKYVKQMVGPYYNIVAGASCSPTIRGVLECAVGGGASAVCTSRINAINCCMKDGIVRGACFCKRY